MDGIDEALESLNRVVGRGINGVKESVNNVDSNLTVLNQTADSIDDSMERLILQVSRVADALEVIGERLNTMQ